MKDLKFEEKKQLKKIRDNVYNKLDETYIYSKDKFVQQIIKETYKQSKEKLIGDLIKEWILINIKKSDKDFFMVFEKKFRADFQALGYKLKSEEKKRRIESPDYPESQEEWEECGWDIDKEEQKLKSEDKGR